MTEGNTYYKVNWLLTALLGAAVAVGGATHKGTVQLMIGTSGVLISCIGYLGLLRPVERQGPAVRAFLLIALALVLAPLFAPVLESLLQLPKFCLNNMPLPLLLVALSGALCLVARQVLRRVSKRQ